MMVLCCRCCPFPCYSCTSLPCENPSCSQRGCTDKCHGIHIGSEASLGGSARVAGDHAGHYGMGFIDFVEMSGDSATFTLSSCNAGQHHLSLTYALGESADHPGPRPMQVSVLHADFSVLCFCLRASDERIRR